VRFLEVILNELKRAGIPESRRGNAGGYLLSEPAENISVGQIIRCFQPQNIAAKSGWNASASQKTFRGNYAFTTLWQQVDSAISEICDSITLAGLVEQEARYRNIYVPNYVI
jgi:Rrf2 family protein